MPKTRQQKEETLKQAIQDIADAKSLVFAGYHGLSVPEIDALRNASREEQVKFQVIKKTLLGRALNKHNIDVEVKQLGDGLAVAYGMSDEVAPAKVLAQFKKDHEHLAIFGGILEKRFIDESSVIALSKLPSHDELIAKVIGSINAPVSGLVNTLSGTIRGFVNVLNALKDAKA